MPSEWDVNAQLRKALKELIYQCVTFMAANILPLLGHVCWPGQFFDKKL